MDNSRRRVLRSLGLAAAGAGTLTAARVASFKEDHRVADALIEMKTICHCGRKAMMNLRVDSQGRAIKRGEQVQIGGNESYIATCRRHFNLEHGEFVEKKFCQVT